MDQVFQEEQAKLREIESTIDRVANSRRKQAIALDKEIAEYYAVDYEDIGRKKLLIDRRSKINGEYEFYRQYKPSPYFARLDLDREIGDDYELSSFYIGKKGLTVGADVVIVDWRTPVGECYYAQNQTSFKIKGIEYSLALRRALNIKNARLINYTTEYDGNTVSLEGDVIDPFLLTVLQDKRRQNRLTDIIRSIQANQNEIIRRPGSENFIVQGCAGSGKTMILLHRLSYLKFNNRQMSLAGIKIITPNQDFNAHINELSGELDIDSIQRFTVEEYYVNLISRFSRSTNVSATVGSESNLNHQLLGELYSMAFLAHLQEQYHAYWDTVLKAINVQRLSDNYRIHDISFPDTRNHNALIAANLENGIHRIIGEIRESIEKYNEQQRRINVLEAEYQQTCDTKEQMASEVATIRSHMIEMLGAELAIISDRITQMTHDIQPSRIRLHELEELDNGVSDEVLQAERVLSAIRQNMHSYSEYSSFVRMQDDLSAGVSESCRDQIIKIQEVEEQIKRIPAYNFVKRNSLRRQLQEATDAFSEAAKQFLDAIISEKEAQVAQNSSIAKNQRDEMQKLLQSVETADQEIAQLMSKQKAMEECIAELVDTTKMSQRIILSVGTQDEIIAYLADYEKLTQNVDKQEKHLLDIQKRIDVLKTQIKEPYDEDLAYLEQCEAEAEKLKANEIYKHVMRKEILAAYKKYGVEYTRTNYRHKLFVMLMFCSLYYMRMSSTDSYLNIDEAQDISVAEYHLLRKILGEKCIFNLYGDINQALLPEKCIMDWEDLSDVIGDKVFILNEDYRNTLQITEYCNKEFFSEIYPIGIKGEPVSEMPAAQAIRWLVDLKKKNPEHRTSVIVSRPKDSVRAMVSESINEQEVSWYKVDDKKLSVLTVENAKGLEFEAVVVLCDGMEINEQYIAYTRALDHLCVVK